MNILVIDTFSHMPFMNNLFPDCDYHSDITNIDNNKSYDFAFVSFPTEDVYLYEKTNSTNESWQTEYRLKIKNIHRAIETANCKKLIIFDSGDYPFYDDEWYISRGYNFDKVFKVECREIAKSDYTNKVVPFPYMLFGSPCATKYLLDNYNPKSTPDINSCYWGSGALLNQLSAEKGMEWILHDRLNLFNSIKDNLVVHNQVSFDEFTNRISKHKFFCVLNGSGRVHRRLWEGLTFNCMPIIQKNDIIYPEGMYKPDDYLYFETPEEFKSKLEELQENQKLYTDLMQKQMDTIITKQKLKDYILKNI